MRVLNCISDGYIFLRNTVDHLSARQRAVAAVAVVAIAFVGSFLAGTSLLLACCFTAGVISGSTYCFWPRRQQAQEDSLVIVEAPVETSLVVRERCGATVETSLVVRERCGATVEGLYDTIERGEYRWDEYRDVVEGTFFLRNYEQLGECACPGFGRAEGGTRDAFEKRFIKEIEWVFPDKNQRVEITFLGSGRCLQEIIVLMRLKASGYEDIKLNIIDTVYQNPADLAVLERGRSFDYVKLQEEVGQILGCLREEGRFAVEVNFMNSYREYVGSLRAEEREAPGALMFYDFDVYAHADVVEVERDAVDGLVNAVREGANLFFPTKVFMYARSSGLDRRLHVVRPVPIE
jgi:hypothetical protein